MTIRGQLSDGKRGLSKRTRSPQPPPDGPRPPQEGCIVILYRHNTLTVMVVLAVVISLIALGLSLYAVGQVNGLRNGADTPPAAASATAEVSKICYATVSTAIPLRPEPDFSAASIKGLNRSSQLAVLGYSIDRDWIEVLDETNTQGWVVSSSVQLDPEAIACEEFRR